jgi:tetratricopeptide (TPR) repeat protein
MRQTRPFHNTDFGIKIIEGGMKLRNNLQLAACLAAGLLAAAPAGAQGFGLIGAKEKVTLLRKLPALVPLTGTTFVVKVVGRSDQADLSRDLQSMLETEITKGDPALRVDEGSPADVITCRIIDFSHPKPTVSTRPSVAVGKNAPKEQSYLRVTGSLTIAFQARGAGGRSVASENVIAKYDREFDASGNSVSEGVKGTVSSAWKRVTGGAGSEDLNAPTDAELQNHLLLDAVHQIAEQVVNTRETVEVYLAKQKGALDEGDKLAAAGLWERALETFETATPSPKPAEDAYRLYDTGVAYEALAYQAEDPQAAMKYLDQAAINYGKAIDSRPEEHYFLEPQKRIEDAIAHYRQINERNRHQAVAEPPPAPAADAKASSAHALTNDQVVAMVKSGMDDDTVVQAIKNAKLVHFDLTPAGQQTLTAGGVSAPVVAAMKTRAARTLHAAPTHTAQK